MSERERFVKMETIELVAAKRYSIFTVKFIVTTETKAYYCEKNRKKIFVLDPSDTLIESIPLAHSKHARFFLGRR